MNGSTLSEYKLAIVYKYKCLCPWNQILFLGINPTKIGLKMCIYAHYLTYTQNLVSLSSLDPTPSPFIFWIKTNKQKNTEKLLSIGITGKLLHTMKYNTDTVWWFYKVKTNYTVGPSSLSKPKYHLLVTSISYVFLV